MTDSYDPEKIQRAFEWGEYESVFVNAMPHAVAGNPDAQCTIALLYQSGLGVRMDILEAERWLLRAAAENSALAWNNLGSLYAMKHEALQERWGDAQGCWKRAEELGFDCGSPYPPHSPL